MKPEFRVEPGADTPAVQQELARLVRGLSSVAAAKALRGRSIGTTETPIAHGLIGVPSDWWVGTLTADARVWQTRAADATYLYLRASAAVNATVFVA